MLVAVAARPATERMAAVDNRAGVKVARTALLTVARVSVVSVVSVVLVVSAATLWLLKPAKTCLLYHSDAAEPPLLVSLL